MGEGSKSADLRRYGHELWKISTFIFYDRNIDVFPQLMYSIYR